MNKRERLDAAIHHRPVDRAPIALWRHFPGDDLDAEKFARRVVEFQNAYDFDFVKVTPASSFVGEMYGGVLRDAGNREGTRAHVRRAIQTWEDWGKLEPIPLDHPVLRREQDAMRRIREALGGDVPIMQTVFTPLSCARTLSGERYLQDLREHPAELAHALEALSITMTRFAESAADAGADCVFLATQVATTSTLTVEEFEAFGARFDVPLCAALHPRFDFILLHVHGEPIYFAQTAAYPVQGLNWHDRKTPPTLREGKARFAGAVAGGLDEWGVLQASPREITAQVRDAIEQTDGRGLIVAPGCVIPIDTPAANIRAARQAVEYAA